MLGSRGLSERLVLRTAGHAELDMERLRHYMEAPDIEAAIQTNYDVARRLGIGGTPAFIVSDQLIPGTIDISSMQALIDQMRDG